MSRSSARFRRLIAGGLAAATGVAGLAMLATPQVAGAATPGSMQITEFQYNGKDGEFIEFTNVGGAPVDMAGWSFDDSSRSPGAFALGSLGTVQAGESVILSEDSAATFRTARGLCPAVKVVGGNNQNLGNGDEINLYDSSNALIDRLTYGNDQRTLDKSAVAPAGETNNGHVYASWTVSTVGDAEGSTTGTAGGIGSPGKSTRATVAFDPCPIVTPPSAWPGGSAVSTADGANVLGGNMSGLAYEPSGTSAPGVLWAVKNGPGTLFRLVWNGSIWTPDTANGWASGKVLRYPGGAGDPDAEGVTLIDGNPANGIYVSTERNNSSSGTSRPAVLRFDVSGSGTTLTATNDWNLTSDIPGLGANLGLEAIQYLSDSFLVSKGFLDEATGTAYDPATYAGHGSGLFLVGVEQNGLVYAYALKGDGSFTKVATIDTGYAAGVMDLEFEQETSHLWAVCDDSCGGKHETLDIAQTGPDDGKFVITKVHERPTGLPNVNNEGFAIAPQAECVGGFKPTFWSDDSNTDSHALRSGTIGCAELPPVEPTGSVVSDFDGDGDSDIGVFRPSNGTWYVAGSGPVAYGAATDVSVSADYDGDGDTDIAVFRPSTGEWLIQGQVPFSFGAAGDVPVPADYDGNGTADIAVFRPSNGQWFVAGLLNESFGATGDIPVPADYDGNGTADIAVFRPSNGQWFVAGLLNESFGTTGDIPVPADYDGNGTADIAVFRPSNGQWFVAGLFTSSFGTNGDVPVPGDYDGDGTADLALFRPSTGQWYQPGQDPVAFGTNGDIPTAKRPSI